MKHGAPYLVSEWQLHFRQKISLLMNIPPKQGLYSPINKVVIIAQQTWFSGCYGCAGTGKWRGHAAGAGTLFCPVFRLFVLAGTGQRPGSVFLIVVEDRFLSILGLCDLGDGC